MSRHPTARAGTKMLGRYRIERELGRGGMGVVYVATDENTGRLVALKTTMVAGLGSGEKTRNQRRERFIREVRALTQVNHENVVHVFDAGECDDPDLGWLLFYTMEYVEGTTLASLVQEHGALNGGEAAAVVMQVAAGLGEAHAQGIIHRDVKPANIFLSIDGRAKIGDFGIAKIEGSTQITRRDQLVGTPNYLAPEQILGDAVGPPTDVFALGALFFVITQNRPLRQQVDAGALLASANGNDPVARINAVQNLSEGLKRAVARSLERDPARRYIDGTAFADALAEHATRVPALKGSPERAQNFLSEGTSDRSSAFINSNSSGGSLPDAEAMDIQSLPDIAGGDAGSIEAIAAAMLGEVERRATGTFKQPSPGAIDPLPVAQTESTVMFNMREMEERHASRKAAAAPTPAPHPVTASTSSLAAAPAAPLPVARTESTAIFRLSEGGPDPVGPSPARKAARIELEPVDDDGGPPGARKTDWEDATHESAPMPVAPLPSTPASVPGPRAVTPTTTPFAGTPVLVAPTLTTSEKLEALRAKLPPRPVLIAACFVAGMVLGLSLAVALSGPPAVPGADPETPDLDVAPLQSRPALCPDRPVSPEEQAQGAAFLDDARAWRRDGASVSKIIETLRFGIAKDPSNHALFYELGRVSNGREQDDADECVCQIAANSKECGTVEKARGR
ncbi:MAG: protein kinase [Deltaproteobacteria bacterium]|nr:protein kinase [Deltaproteobacteria bacterium]